MQTAILSVTLILLILLILLVLWLINRHMDIQKSLNTQNTMVGLFQQQLDTLKTGQDQTGHQLNESLRSSQAHLMTSLHTGNETLSKLHKQIGHLEGTGQQMVDLAKDIRGLQQILGSPKLRGQLGEWSLENLLAVVLPSNSYQTQFRFHNGKQVDAMIKMRDYAVSVDAKFPLASFYQMLETDNPQEQKQYRSQFLKDVRKHIHKIANDYIQPSEDTLDFALMYIPAENVYYETVVRQDQDTLDLLQLSLEKRVIPVSPNLLYAYLMTITMGLHGLQIEKQAAHIRKHLSKLSGDFQGLTRQWDTLGSHIRNAGAKYEETRGLLNGLSLQLRQILPEQEGESS